MKSQQRGPRQAARTGAGPAAASRGQPRPGAAAAAQLQDFVLFELLAEVEALQRRVALLEGALERLRRAHGAGLTEPERRGWLVFDAARFAALRGRLGLSLSEMGRQLGVSAVSVHKWEKGQARPRPRQLAAIAGLSQSWVRHV
jgi:DNA-binding transcriptional regulator YiaG